MTSTSQLPLNQTMVCPFHLASTWALVAKSTITMTMCLKHKATPSVTQTLQFHTAGWTLTVDQDGIDNLFDDTQQEDVKLSGTVAGVAVAITSDQENKTSSYSVGGTVAGVALTFTGTDNDDAVGTGGKLLRSQHLMQWAMA